MAMTWTKEQQQVIQLRDRNILVSAAAGSGKTAVLVERIIAMITDPKHPTDVSRLLVVTFTRAAAAEMKERIRKAIEKRLEENGENEHLRQQATLIYSAQITTIDSFCQMVVREHFHRIDLDPGFRVAEEGELRLLKQDVLRELLEEKYAEGKKEFLDFVEAYALGRDDGRLEELLLRLHTYSHSYPDPKEWLEGCLGQYEGYGIKEGIPEAVEQKLLGLFRSGEKEASELLYRAQEICQEPDGPFIYEEMLLSDLVVVESMSAASTLEELYDRAAPIRQKTAWMRLSQKKPKGISPEKRALAKALRDEAKKLLEELCTQYLYETPKKMAEDMENCRGMATVLTELVKEFAVRFAAKKRERNIIDFNDMEHFALQILAEKQDGKWIPTQAAKEYQEQFDEVMIDEYQDSNLLQEVILSSVSTMSRGKNNMFMVGDVKQSIYRFRLACPELFMEKFERYTLEESENQRIDLHKNFRSRKEVLESANFVFRKIMRKELGGIEYDDRAALCPGVEFPPAPEEEELFRTELLLLDTDKSELEEETEESGRELEARAVAGEIRRLMRSGWILDDESGNYRRPRFRDIVILTRSVKGWTDVFTEVLNREGIPTYAGTSEGYFATYEVRILLDYLRILDNWRQDFPLAAVLTSPLCGLNAEQLAEMRNSYPDKRFYEVFAACCEETEQAEIDEETRRILRETNKTIQYFREKLAFTSIRELLWEILQKTGYYAMLSVMPGGEQRKANLDMLLVKAAEFEESSYKGLFHFVRYIEQLQKYEVDYGEANITDEGMDAVRFLSIHKSKGLEFPIVFLCGLGKGFNTQDAKAGVVLHSELGIGMDAVDLELRTKTPTILKKMIQREIRLDNLGEELRVLYVAMTRAKEKLIMTGTVVKAEKLFEKYLMREAGWKGKLSFRDLSGAGSYLDWLLPPILGDRDNSPVKLRVMKLGELAETALVAEQAESMAKEVLQNWDDSKILKPEWRAELKEQLDFEVSEHNKRKMQLKFTVSELKKRAYLAEEEGQEMLREPEIIPLLPKFLQEEHELKGASKGSAYHRLLELLDFTVLYDRENLNRELRRLQEEKRLSAQMADCIHPEEILGFLQTDLGRRMRKAAQNGRLVREQPFVLGVEASEIYPELQSKDMLLVQGIIDVYFEEENSIILLDYKTDRMFKDEEFREKYAAQLNYYAAALERMLEKQVKEKWIYSFAMQKNICL